MTLRHGRPQGERTCEDKTGWTSLSPPFFFETNPGAPNTGQKTRLVSCTADRRTRRTILTFAQDRPSGILYASRHNMMDKRLEFHTV